MLCGWITVGGKKREEEIGGCGFSIHGITFYSMIGLQCTGHTHTLCGITIIIIIYIFIIIIVIPQSV